MLGNEEGVGMQGRETSSGMEGGNVVSEWDRGVEIEAQSISGRQTYAPSL